jgi:O-antigen ligase
MLDESKIKNFFVEPFKNTKNFFVNLNLATFISFAIYLVFLSLVVVSILNPAPTTIKGFVGFVGLIACFLLKQEQIIYLTTFSLFFAYQLRYFSTIPNGAIFVMLLILFIKSIIERRSVINLALVFKNPFFLPSIFILLCYLISIIKPFSSHSNGLELHIEMIKGLLCVFTYCWILIGFIESKQRLINMGLILLIMLVGNLAFGLITLVKPDFVILPGYLESGSMIGESAAEFRVAGLTFKWEAYAEYLMMAVIFIASFLMRYKMTTKHKIMSALLLLLTAFELLLTNTRGPIVVVCLGLSILIFFNKRINLIKKILFLLTVTILIAGSLFVADKTGLLRISERFETFAHISQTKYGPIPAARYDAWVPAIDRIVKDKCLGVGPSYYPFTGYFSKLSSGPLWPHNSVLMILATIGFYGLIAYFFLFTRMWSSYKRSAGFTDEFTRVFSQSLGLAIFMLMIDSLKFDGFLRQPDSYFYFVWLVFALFFCIQNLNTQSVENQPVLQ